MFYIKIYVCKLLDMNRFNFAIWIAVYFQGTALLLFPDFYQSKEASDGYTFYSSILFQDI